MYFEIVVILLLLCMIYILIDNEPINEKKILISQNHLTIKDINVPKLSHKYHGNNNIIFYNLSVYKVKGGFRGVVRGTNCNGCSFYSPPPLFSYIYLIELSEEGAINKLEIVNYDYGKFNNCGPVHANGLEDPRIFMHKGDEWIMANVLGSKDQNDPCINTMFISKLSDPMNTFRLLKVPYSFDPYQKQKNWAPFSMNNKLLCEYSLFPHIVLEIDENTGDTTVFDTTGISTIDIYDTESMRCSTPPILINNEYYLSVGHQRSSQPCEYYHFFYRFNKTPPFIITHISDKFKLEGLQRIQFACGLSFSNGNIYLSYGVNDCYNRISSYSLSDVEKLLTHNICPI